MSQKGVVLQQARFFPIMLEVIFDSFPRAVEQPGVSAPIE